MPRLFPFEAMTYDEAVAGPLELITAPPYDVISDERRRAHLSASPYSVVHIDLAEGSPDPGDPDSRYSRAARLLTTWEQDRALIRSTVPSLFGYEMRYRSGGARSQIRGVLGAIDLPPSDGVVIPHERTMPGPVEDRLMLLRAIRTHVSPVYGVVAGPHQRLTQLLASSRPADPGFTVEDEQHVHHLMWPIHRSEPLDDGLGSDPMLIADGHHRYATALRYRDERGASDGAGRWDRVLTFLVDAGSQPITVAPFHRIQLDGEMRAEGDPVSSLHELLETISDEEMMVGLAFPAREDVGYRVRILHGNPPAVRALHTEVLDRLEAPPTLRYVPDALKADDAVRRRIAVGAWFLPPTTPERIRIAAERGEPLPQKSTYFWPKPRTGMVMMPLD